MMDRIRLFWSTSKNCKNFGDELSPYIISKLSKSNVECIFPIGKVTKSNLIAILSLLYALKEYSIIELIRNIFNRNVKHILGLGSIINRSNSKSIIWGSGIVVKDDKIKKADFRAVRGPLTQKRLKELGYITPPEMGDPGLLLSKLFKPTSSRENKIGLIPHSTDYDFVSSIVDNDQIEVINVRTDNIEGVINQINMCSLIISSSLHGIIISHSYCIPALWFKFSNNIAGDNIKFYDYYYSVEIFNVVSFSFTSCCINNIDDVYALYEKNKAIALPKPAIINLRCEQLLKSAPFKINIDV